MSLPRLPRTGRGSYLYERSATHRHRGIDLASPTGTPVYAVAPGRVSHAVEAGTVGFRGYGRAVVIAAEDGTHHLYAHLDSIAVRPGDRIEAGAIVGTVGRTGVEHSGAHLHFEVSDRPYPMDSEAPRRDPVAYLTAGQLHPLAARAATPAQFANVVSSRPSSSRSSAPAGAAFVFLVGAVLVAAVAAKGS